MKKTTLILSLVVCIFSIVHADTIDYWHVYYNKEKIKECTEFSLPEIVIKSAIVKENDSITIKYYSDALAFNSVMLYYSTGDTTEHLLTKNNSPQFFKFIFSFSIKQLIQNREGQKNSGIEVFFAGVEDYNKKLYKSQVLKIKFE